MRLLFPVFASILVGCWGFAFSAPLNATQNKQMEQKEVQHNRDSAPSPYPAGDSMEHEEVDHYRKEGVYNNGDKMEVEEKRHYNQISLNSVEFLFAPQDSEITI